MVLAAAELVASRMLPDDRVGSTEEKYLVARPGVVLAEDDHVEPV